MFCTHLLLLFSFIPSHVPYWNHNRKQSSDLPTTPAGKEGTSFPCLSWDQGLHSNGWPTWEGYGREGKWGIAGSSGDQVLAVLCIYLFSLTPFKRSPCTMDILSMKLSSKMILLLAHDPFLFQWSFPRRWPTALLPKWETSINMTNSLGWYFMILRMGGEGRDCRLEPPSV